MKITKKQSISFVQKMKKELQNIGAVPFISDELQFDLKTKYGILWLRIDDNNESCFSVFSRFVNKEKIPNIEGINSYSGKFNHHLTGKVDSVVFSVISNINFVINIK